VRRQSFSALQRAENSSIAAERDAALYGQRFSALQRAENSSMGGAAQAAAIMQQVSVLFSEPKIPQWDGCALGGAPTGGFSALQRAENSSILIV